MLRRLALSLIAIVWGLLPLQAAFNSFQVNGGGSPANTVFTALHTYFISPTGNDGNPGTSAGSPWLTPNHSVVCGDVIIAAAGTYTTQFSSSWGAVSTCPSTTGGIDGTGGIYFAVVLCAGPAITSCQVNGTVNSFNVYQSDWAVEGFSATVSTSESGCYLGESANTTTQNYLAFINDIANVCGNYGFGTTGAGANKSFDMTAFVGVIAYNASSSLVAPCDSGLSLIPSVGSVSSAGTHQFVAGAFSYANINASGATCQTDGEGIELDSWACGPNYPYQGVIEQSVFWANGSAGIEIFPNTAACSGTDVAQYYVFNNTSYGNMQDPRKAASVGEITLNDISPTSTAIYSITNNIAEATVATQSSQDMFALAPYCTNNCVSLTTMSGNWAWQSNPATGNANPLTGSNTTAVGNFNTDAYVNGTHFPSTWPLGGTNTYGNPLFSDTGALPSGAPACSSYADVTDCMNTGYSIASNLSAGASGTSGLGYFPPKACTGDSYFPTWLKGIVYLQWNGSSLTENAGLITKPCGM